MKKKIWANFRRIIELFTKKKSLSSQKYGFGIRDPEKKPIPDPGVKKAPDPGSGSQHWSKDYTDNTHLHHDKHGNAFIRASHGPKLRKRINIGKSII
jgi:hypothetical protein